MLPEWVSGGVEGARAAVGNPLALLALFAIALMSQGRHARTLAIVLLALLGAFACGWLPPHPAHPTLAAGLLAGLGVAAASGWHLPRTAGLACVLAGGFAFGLAAGLPLALPSETAGSLVVALVLLGLLLMIGTLLQRRWSSSVPLRYGPRVLGAWIAAIGLLLMALQAWGQRG